MIAISPVRPNQNRHEGFLLVPLPMTRKGGGEEGKTGEYNRGEKKKSCVETREEIKYHGLFS